MGGEPLVARRLGRADALLCAKRTVPGSACFAARRLWIETYSWPRGSGFCSLLLLRQDSIRVAVRAAALLAINEWMLKPLMAAAHARGAAHGLTFGAWHGVSALLYVVACLAGVEESY